EPNRSDWLNVCLPMGMLTLVFPNISYPLERQTNPWLDEVDCSFLSLAEAIYATSPFNLAVMDEEVSGGYSAREMTTSRLPQSGFLAPPDLAQQVHPDVPGVVLPSGLHWFAPHQPK